MPQGKDDLPGNKKEEQGRLSTVDLVPLLALIFQILEFLLKILGWIE